MHVDPEWARRDGPYQDTIAFGFLTMSLLTHLLHSALGTCSDRVPTSGHYLNLGFDRLRLVSPVPVDSRIRGHFKVRNAARDEQGRVRVSFDAAIEVEGSDRPALVAEWLSIWVPHEEKGAPESSPAA
jgi:acyl dehydratase